MVNFIDQNMPLVLNETLGSLLGSIVNAQVTSANASIDFIHQVGLLPKKEGETAQELETIKFKYQKLDADNNPTNFVLEVPLLALVNIPSMSVKKATISFAYDVVQTSSLKGRIRNIKEIESTTNTEQKGGIKFDIELEQQPFPVGFNDIFNALELAATNS